jgi:hypothetical protein
MKWVSALMRGIVLFFAFTVLNFIFNFAVQIGTEKWKNVNVSLGAIPKAAVALHMFITQYAAVVGFAFFLLCLALSFLETARKK